MLRKCACGQRVEAGAEQVLLTQDRMELENLHLPGCTPMEFLLKNDFPVVAEKFLPKRRHNEGGRDPWKDSFLICVWGTIAFHGKQTGLDTPRFFHDLLPSVSASRDILKLSNKTGWWLRVVGAGKVCAQNAE